METTLLKYLEKEEKKTNHTHEEEASNIYDYQNKHQCLEYLPPFLVKTWALVNEDEESFATKDIIKDLFKNIFSFIYDSDDFLASTALKGLKHLLEAYYLPEYCNFSVLKDSRTKTKEMK